MRWFRSRVDKRIDELEAKKVEYPTTVEIVKRLNKVENEVETNNERFELLKERVRELESDGVRRDEKLTEWFNEQTAKIDRVKH